MSNQALDKQLDVTVKILLTLMTEPKLKADQIAKMLDVSPNYIARMLMRFRDGGLEVEYDFKKMQYVGKFNEQLQKSVLGSYTKKLKKTISQADFSQQSTRFVTSLDRYTVPQFAEFLGVSPQNIYNGINGYKGQKLPSGWVAYQSTENGNWMVTKARTNRDGKVFEVPPEIKNMHRYVLGEGSALTPKAKASKCVVTGCPENVIAKGMCQSHYYQARRHPERFTLYLSDR